MLISVFFSEEWSKDESSHWHVCIDEKCDEIADLADHIWDEGTITTPATQEADGVKTFTCTVCDQTKTEPVLFNGMTETEWNATMADDVFANFAYNESASVSGSGITVETVYEYKFTADKVYMKLTIAGQSTESTFSDRETVELYRSEHMTSMKEMMKFDCFEYDADTKTYKAVKGIYIAEVDTTVDDITATFENGKLVEVKYSFILVSEGIEMTAVSTITMSDYGTVEL